MSHSLIVATIVRRTEARRVLEIGAGSGETALAVARVLGTGGMLIAIERDQELAAAARQRLTAAGYADKVTVVNGDASRYLHKLAGPFDVIFQDGDSADYAPLHERIVKLLAPSGTLIVSNVTRAGGYNELLTEDSRLEILSADNGIAIAVRRPTTP